MSAEPPEIITGGFLLPYAEKGHEMLKDLKIYIMLLASFIIAGLTGCGGGGSSMPSRSGTATTANSSAVLVAIEVSPTNPSIANGTTEQFTATGIYSNNTTEDLTASVTWGSSDTACAKFMSSGQVQGT